MPRRCRGSSPGAGVPNLKGAERAIEVGAHSMLIPMSASRAHSAANVRKTPEEMLTTIAAIRAARDAAGSKTRIEVGMSTAFGCTLQGDVPEDDVIALLQGALDAGAECVGLADTVGYADPGQVRRLFDVRCVRWVTVLPARTFTTHAVSRSPTRSPRSTWGIRRFDASTAGIGGCPHAPGASGNASTEDVVFMLTRMGYDTGIDLDRLLALRQQIAGWLQGEQLGGAIWRAGVPKSASSKQLAA